MVTLEHTPLYIRGGHTIPIVQFKNKENVDLHIALKKSHGQDGQNHYKSSGVFILDDGESLHSYISSMMYYIQIS